MGRRTIITAVTAAGAVTAATLAVGIPSDGLPAAASCEALRQWYVRAALPETGPWGLSGPPVLYRVQTRTRESGSAAAWVTGRATGTGTGTNVAEANVDESDVAKTDGRLLVCACSAGRWSSPT